MPSIPRFYVYVLARPNDKPFYVGKGRGDRIYDHEAEARRGHRCHKCNVIRKIWHKGGEVQRYTVFATDDEQEAYAYEIQMIAFYGRDTLVNRTDGGDGVRGMQIVRSRQHWERQRVAQIARFQDAAVREQLRQSSIRYRQTPEAKEQIRQHNIRRWSDPEQHERLRQQNHKRWSDPEQRARLADRNRTPEMRERLRETRLKQWSDPAYREKMRQAQGRRSYIFLSPDGERVQVSDLSEFCREHNLDVSGMSKVGCGKVKVHRGWRCYQNKGAL